MITLGYGLSFIKTQRASVVPYTIINNELYFLFGIHSETGDITDFGGGVKKNENSLSSSSREWKEETKGIFGDAYNINNLVLDGAIYDKTMAVLFVPVNNRWYYTADKIFQNVDIPLRKDNQEISKMLWVSYSNFKILLSYSNKRLWERIKKFYRRELTKDVIDMLYVIYDHHH
jgi:hypothetical protein